MSFKSKFIFFFSYLIQSQTPNSKKFDEPEYVFYIFLGISIIMIILNLIGIKKMCYINVPLLFEEWVLISGIIEIILSLIYLKIIRIPFFIITIQTFQIIITLFMTKRFYQTYLILNESKSRCCSECFNFYFLIFLLFNIIFLLVIIFLFLWGLFKKKIIEDFYLYNVTPLIFDSFGLLTSIVLIIIGLKLKAKMIEQNLLQKKKQ